MSDFEERDIHFVKLCSQLLITEASDFNDQNIIGVVFRKSLQSCQNVQIGTRSADFANIQSTSYSVVCMFVSARTDNADLKIMWKQAESAGVSPYDLPSQHRIITWKNRN